MGLMDDIKVKGHDAMESPEHKDKIEQLAKERNISMDDARKKMMQKKDGK